MYNTCVIDYNAQSGMPIRLRNYQSPADIVFAIAAVFTGKFTGPLVREASLSYWPTVSCASAVGPESVE